MENKKLTKPSDIFKGSLGDKLVNLIEHKFNEINKSNNDIVYNDKIVIVVNGAFPEYVIKNIVTNYIGAGWKNVQYNLTKRQKADLEPDTITFTFYNK
jgi:hypothetical protein